MQTLQKKNRAMVSFTCILLGAGGGHSSDCTIGKRAVFINSTFIMKKCKCYEFDPHLEQTRLLSIFQPEISRIS